MGSSSKVVDFDRPVDVSALAGKSVLITGGASGMGAMMATTFAQHKYAPPVVAFHVQQWAQGTIEPT